MPFKVKEHFRKTKKGLSRVKESSRKDRTKKALTIGASSLVTLGLGALAYKKLGSKLVKGAVSISKKGDDVAVSKAKDITALLTPKKLTTGTKSYETLPDPWLEGSTTVSKSKKILTTGKKETKLLTGNKYTPEDIPDPWNSSVKPKPKIKKKITETKETLALPGSKYKAETIADPWDDIVSTTKSNKPSTINKTKKEQLLLTGSKSDYVAPTKPSVISVRRNKDLGGEIRSQRTLIGREPKDIAEANKKLELAKRYETSDSPALQRTGASYRKRAEERLTVISSRSPSKKQTGLVTTRGNASKGTNRSSNYQPKTREPKKKEQLTVTKETVNVETPKVQKKKKSRRDLLTGKTTAQELTDNFIESSTKAAINKAGDSVSDIIIPGSSIVNRTIRDVKGRAKQVERLSNELAESGDKVTSRRGFLKRAAKKTATEASLRPRDAENIASGTVKRTKVTIRKAGSTGTANPEVNYTTDSRFPVQGGVRISKRVYRQPKGLLERMGQRLRKAARYKSGNYDTRYD